MKFFVALALLVAAAAAVPVGDEKNAGIVSQSSSNIGTPDGYVASYETENGIKSQEQSVVEGLGTPEEAAAVRGSYSYPGPDGVVYTVTYTAGKEGFVPSGAHLPQVV